MTEELPGLVGAVRRPEASAASPPAPARHHARMGVGWLDRGGSARRDHRLGHRERPSDASRTGRRERHRRDRRRGAAGGPRRGGRHVRSRDRLRGDHRRPCAGGRDRLDPRPRGRPARQGDGVRRRARMGDRARAAGLQPEPVLEERIPLPIFHDLADRAYFRGTALVSAANNVRAPSYPSLFSSVFSVAAHAEPDPWRIYYNPAPPVEFGAWGVDVPVAWKDGGGTVATGNSFAAPHIAGLVASILSKHPGLSPFEVKGILASVADNPGRRHLAHEWTRACEPGPNLRRALPPQPSPRPAPGRRVHLRHRGLALPGRRPGHRLCGEQLAVLLGIVGAARILPYVLLSVPAGIVADRFDRRMVLLVTDVARGIIMLILVARSSSTPRRSPSWASPSLPRVSRPSSAPRSRPCCRCWSMRATSVRPTARGPRSTTSRSSWGRARGHPARYRGPRDRLPPQRDLVRGRSGRPLAPSRSASPGPVLRRDDEPAPSARAGASWSGRSPDHSSLTRSPASSVAALAC